MKTLLTIGLACGLALTALGYPGEHLHGVLLRIAGVYAIATDIEDTGDYLMATCTCADGSVHMAIGYPVFGHRPEQCDWRWIAQ